MDKIERHSDDGKAEDEVEAADDQLCLSVLILWIERV